jgi:pimeloyl-ACP methyl ester carboxylesterase
MRKGLIIAIIAIILIGVVLKLPGYNNEQPIPKANHSNFSSSYPVILVHGWMGKAIDFNSYGIRLQEDGVAEYKGAVTRYDNESICPDKWPKAIAVSAEYYYEDNENKGIEAYAGELEHDVELVMKCTDAKKVIIIAHSMGGLVSRKYMADYGDKDVEKLITLATPHYGFNAFTRSEIIIMIFEAFTGRTYEVEQMFPDSEFLKKLDKDDISYRNKMVSIGTYNLDNSTLLFDLPVLTDNIRDKEKQLFSNTDIIVPLDSTKLAGAKYYLIKGCTHTQITNFKSAPGKGPINNAKACPEAYYIVKNEVLDSVDSILASSSS